MRNLLLTIGALAAVLSLSVGLASASPSTRSASAGATVAAANSGLGRILVDGHGHTLYLFGKDRSGRSSCTGKCAAFWPPLIASGKIHAAAGARASAIGTTRRADGRLQVTYYHHPLYRFVKDVSAGQTIGEEVDAFGAEWYALSPAGARAEKNAAAGSPAAPAGGYGSGSGYGY